MLEASFTKVFRFPFVEARLSSVRSCFALCCCRWANRRAGVNSAPVYKRLIDVSLSTIEAGIGISINVFQ